MNLGLIRRFEATEAHAEPVPLFDRGRDHRGCGLWDDFRTGEFRQSEAARHDDQRPAGQVPQEIAVTPGYPV